MSLQGSANSNKTPFIVSSKLLLIQNSAMKEGDIQDLLNLMFYLSLKGIFRVFPLFLQEPGWCYKEHNVPHPAGTVSSQ